MMNWKIVAFLLLVYRLPVEAQAVVSVNQVLSTVRTEPLMSEYEQNLDFLKATGARAPLLDKVEFRTANNSFLFSDQEYALRFSTNALWKRGVEKGIHQMQVERQQAEMTVQLDQELKERYQLVVDAVYLARLLEMGQRLAGLLEERQRLWHTSLQAGADVSVDELAELEDALLQQKARMMSLQSEQQAMNMALNVLLGLDGPARIDTTGWLDVSEIVEYLLPGPEIAAVPAGLQQKKLEQEMMKWEVEKERADNLRVLDFVQTEYNGNRGSRFDEVFAFRMGLNIPFVGSYRQQLDEALVEERLAGQEFQSAEKEQRRKQRTVEQQLLLLSRQYSLLQEDQNEALSLRLLANPEILQLMAPEEVSSLKELALKKQLRLINLEYEIMDTWVAYLSVSGKMTALPLRNYLSAEWVAF